MIEIKRRKSNDFGINRILRYWQVIIAIILASVAWGVLVNKQEQVDDTMKTHIAVADKLAIQYEGRISRLEESIITLDKEIPEIRQDVKRILERLPRRVD